MLAKNAFRSAPRSLRHSSAGLLAAVCLSACSDATFDYSSDVNADTAPQLVEQRLQLHEKRAQQLEQLLDKDSRLARFLYQQERQSHYWTLESIAFDLSPEGTHYADDALARVAEFNHPDAMHDSFVGALAVYFEPTMAGCPGAAGTGLVVELPFTYPFRHTLEPVALVLGSGDKLMFEGHESNNRLGLGQPDIQPNRHGATNPNQQAYCLTADDEDIPREAAYVEAQWQALIPQHIESLTLDAASLGEAQEVAGYSVTLLALNAQNYRVAIQAPQDTDALSVQQIVAQGMTSDGRMAAARGTAQQTAAQLADTDALVAQSIREAQRGQLILSDARHAFQQLQAKHSPVGYLEAGFAFHAPIEAAHISLLLDGQQRGAEVQSPQRIEIAVTPRP